VENDIVNLCYLSERKGIREAGSIDQFEQETISKNPLLKYILNSSDRIFDKPLVINEVSFLPKGPIENNILMTGDSAGMIAPLCGNGMAIAIHSAKILGECIYEYCQTPSSTLEQLFSSYSHQWEKQFLFRLRRGRILQHLFGNHFVSEFAVQLALRAKPFARAMVKSSHGKPF
jgi:flavin-dependent dehydrogenase